MRRALAVLWFFATAAVLCGPRSAFAQPADAAPVNPLAVKQQMIQDRVARLEDRMFRLRETLEKTEPENARKLADALQRSGELDLKSRLQVLTDALRASRNLHDAATQQDALVRDMEALLDVLLDRDPNDARRAEEMKRMAELKEEVDRLLAEQRAARETSAKAIRAQRLGAQIEAAARRVQDLLERQEQLREASQQASGERLAANAEAQQRLAEQAEQLAEDLERLAAEAKQASPPRGGEPNEDPPAEADAQRNRQTPPNGATPSEAADPSPQKQNGTADSPSESQPSGEKKLDAAGQDTRSGAQDMKSAAEKLEAQESEGAAEKQESAEEKLRRALHRLQEEQKEAEKAAENAKRAAEQRQLADRARKTAERMKPQDQQGESPQSGQQGEQNQQDGKPQQGGQQGQQQKGQQGQQGEKGEKQDSAPQKPTPGQENVERAAPHMDRAAEELDEEKDEEAIQNQDKALDELERAAAELEEALKQNRLEEQEERLRGLQSRLEELAARQKSINAETVPLAEKGADSFTRAESLKCAELATRQDEQATGIGDCLRLLEEDGTTVVFPAVFRQLEQDMKAVATRLRESKVGPLTTGLQQDLARTLDDLVEALRRLREKRKEQQKRGAAGGGAGAPGDAPLVPTSAELKMLKQAQLRVNSTTKTVADARQAGGEDEADLAESLQQAAGRQAELQAMALEMQQRAEKEHGP